jgi:hypothetical protein
LDLNLIKGNEDVQEVEGLNSQALSLPKTTQAL